VPRYELRRYDQALFRERMMQFLVRDEEALRYRAASPYLDGYVNATKDSRPFIESAWIE
jgi:hypothetical protein